MSEHKNIADALTILAAIGMPAAQQNDRSALCLLALLNLTADRTWARAENPLIGITPMMNFSRDHYGKPYAPNTRETFRRQTIHQFVDAGIALYNPDDPARAVNSPKAVYQVAPEALALFRLYGGRKWNAALKAYLATHQTLSDRYAQPREQKRVPVQLAAGRKIRLSPGAHSELIKAVVEEFSARFLPDGVLVYVGDTGNKWGYFDEVQLRSLGVAVDAHGKMPDVIIYCPRRNWLVLVESVTSYGPVDGKRHRELARLFADSTAGLVFITAFPSRSLAVRYMLEIAWETDVWIADAPSHMIHFNGSRFLGPYN